jgi:hypothetical protein
MTHSDDTVMEAVVKAARDGGASYPKAVAEILRPSLYVEQQGATPCIYATWEGQSLPVEAAVAKMRETPRHRPLFTPGGKPDVRELTPTEYRAIRRKNPELFGMRPR